VPTSSPQAGANANAASVQNTPVTASEEAQISPKARALAEFYEAASAFIQEEHFETFTGWKLSNGSSGYVLNRESAYLDVEKYNNYLFDKAATTLVDEARQLGLALDKDEALAQLLRPLTHPVNSDDEDRKKLDPLTSASDTRTSTLSRLVESLTGDAVVSKRNKRSPDKAAGRHPGILSSGDLSPLIREGL
jgi:hypothetical protein